MSTCSDIVPCLTASQLKMVILKIICTHPIHNPFISQTSFNFLSVVSELGCYKLLVKCVWCIKRSTCGTPAQMKKMCNAPFDFVLKYMLWKYVMETNWSDSSIQWYASAVMKKQEDQKSVWKRIGVYTVNLLPDPLWLDRNIALDSIPGTTFWAAVYQWLPRVQPL